MGKIADKFNEYKKWGATKFTDFFTFPFINRTHDDGEKWHLQEIRLKTYDAIISIEEWIVNKVKKSNVNGNIVVDDNEMEVYKHPNHSGDIISDSDGNTVLQSNTVKTDNIVNNSIPNNKFAKMQSYSVKGNNLAVENDVLDLTIGQLLAMLNAEIKDNKNVANGYLGLNSDTKIDSRFLPAIAITDTYPVSSEAEMLSIIGAERGDVAIRSDLRKTFILATEPSSIIGSWKELLTPTDLILSVNGKTGIIILNTDDIAEGINNKYFTDERAKHAVLAQTKKIAKKMAIKYS